MEFDFQQLQGKKNNETLKIWIFLAVLLLSTIAYIIYKNYTKKELSAEEALKRRKKLNKKNKGYWDASEIVTLYQTRRHNRKRIHKKNRHLDNDDYYYRYPNKNNLESFNPQAYQSEVASKEYFKDLVRHELIDNAVFNKKRDDLGSSLDQLSEKSKIPSVIIQTFMGKDYNTEDSLKKVIQNNALLNRDTLEELDFLKEDLQIVGKKVQIIQRKLNEFLNVFENLFEEAKRNNGKFTRFQYDTVQEELKNLQKENRTRQEEQKIRTEDEVND